MATQELTTITLEQTARMFPHIRVEDGLETVAVVLDAVAEAIKALGSVPSGHLYAMLQGTMSLSTYQGIIAGLKRGGLVKESNHLLTWESTDA